MPASGSEEQAGLALILSLGWMVTPHPDETRMRQRQMIRFENGSLGLDVGLQIRASQSHLPFSSPDYLKAPLCSASV